MNQELEHIKFRESIQTLQAIMEKMGHDGLLHPGEYPVTHYFTPIHEKYGCCEMARAVTVPKGHLIIGKIHKHACLNFVMKGTIVVATEFGNQRFVAPCIFVSPPGTKRAGVVEEDCIWATVHMTEHCGEEHLDKVEDEVIAKTYQEIGLIE